MKNLVNIELFGNINRIGKTDIDMNKRLIDILYEDAGGMFGDKQLELLQVGGPLGSFVVGEDLLNSLEVYNDNLIIPTLMFINDKFCPVDYSRFLLRYVIKELGVSNENLNSLNNLLEEISSGKTRKYTYRELLSELEEDSKDLIETRVKFNISFLLRKYKNVFSEHIEEGKCSVGICNRLFSAQCVNACPAGIDIPGYTALMYEGRDIEAYKLMRHKNPLSLVCGKICARPCEERCRRGEIEQTVGVRALKHYAATTALDKETYTERKWLENGKKIGVIGGGPAGISAAYYLVKTGYDVDLYEKHPVIGGMLAVGVPSYRLSQDTIDKEVELIENLGVRIHKNTEVGKDICFEAIKNNHDSLILATGCHIPNIFSEHLINLESAIDFLREVKLNNRLSVGEKVVVVGGGDVAMDAARTAIRLGANKVDVVSLETFLQMPANDEEKDEARKEGIVFHNGYGTKEIYDVDNIASNITFKKCKKLFNIHNQFSPVYDEDETFSIDSDHIILAIGQRSDISYLDQALDIDDRNRIKYSNKLETSVAGIYVAGDISGPGSAIKAVAEGRKAAVEIDKYLGGKGLYNDDVIEVPMTQSHYAIWDTKAETEEVTLYSEGCDTCFEENKGIFSEEMARLEARRCMRCDRNSKQ